MTFIDDESGVESSDPSEGIEFLLPVGSYRFATGTRDVTINGSVFVAFPSTRADVPTPTFTMMATEVEVRIPIYHQLAQRYSGSEFPPRNVSVNIYRQQPTGVEQILRGQIESMEVEKTGSVMTTAVFKVPSRMAKLLDRKLPTVTISRKCPHFLYDANCRVSRAAYTVTGNVAAINGRTIRVDVAMDDQWARGGDVIHTASGEAMLVFYQTSTFDMSGAHAFITMQGAIYGLAVGDEVKVAAGCSHSVTVCRNKFDNVPNFGGAPQLPLSNPFLPNGLGVNRG